MKFYFSGIESQREFDLLKQAGATHILMDLHQHAQVAYCHVDYNVMIDSGAYRDWKSGNYEDFHRLQQQARLYKKQVMLWDMTRYDAFVAYDVIGNPQLSYTFWQDIFRPFSFMPVWHGKHNVVDQPMRHLEEYLDRAPVVGLGGLVKLLRGGEGEKDKPEKKRLDKLRDETIEWLGELATKYSQRFHLFGCASPNAINALAPYLYSADSSIWIRGRKYGNVLFQHTGHGKFTQAHARYVPDYKEMTPDELCISNAYNIQAFCAQFHKNPPQEESA